LPCRTLCGFPSACWRYPDPLCLGYSGPVGVFRCSPPFSFICSFRAYATYYVRALPLVLTPLSNPLYVRLDFYVPFGISPSSVLLLSRPYPCCHCGNEVQQLPRDLPVSKKSGIRLIFGCCENLYVCVCQTASHCATLYALLRMLKKVLSQQGSDTSLVLAVS
jgi:hypothetical protein